MTRADIADSFIQILVELLGVDATEITPKTDIIKDLDVDELDMIELVMTVEEQFDFEIPDEDVAGSGQDKGGLWRTGKADADILDLENFQLRRVDQWVSYITDKVEMIK